MLNKISLSILILAGTYITASADSKTSSSNVPSKKRNEPIALEFRRTTTKKPLSEGDITGSYDGSFLQINFTEATGSVQVKCTDLMTGDNCKYSTSGNGSSYQYIGEVSGPVQITVTTSESTYECVTFVE